MASEVELVVTLKTIRWRIWLANALAPLIRLLPFARRKQVLYALVGNACWFSYDIGKTWEKIEVVKP